MADGDNNFVTREEYEQFQQRVIDILGIAFQYLDKNLIANRVTQASLNNLVETIENLARMQNQTYEDNLRYGQLLEDIHKKLFGPGK